MQRIIMIQGYGVFNVNDERPEVNIDSVKAILDTVRKEYDYEQDRSKSIDSRASTFLTISATAFALVCNIIKLPTNYILIHSMILICVYTLTLLSLLITVLLFARTLMSKPYKRYKIGDLNSYNVMSSSSNELAPVIISTLCKLIDENSKVNDQKIKYYNLAIVLLIISMFLIGVTTILVKGGY